MSDLLSEIDAALPVRERVDQLAPWRNELAGYVSEMKGLRSMTPDSAMAWLSSVSARALEMMFVTLQSDGRLFTKFRVEMLLPFKEECRYQFSIASRRQSVSQMDWEITRGYES